MGSHTDTSFYCELCNKVVEADDYESSGWANLDHLDYCPECQLIVDAEKETDDEEK